MSRETSERQKVFFEIVLKKDYTVDCWSPSTAQDYAATVRLYKKYHNGRTYQQFLLDVLGRKR